MIISIAIQKGGSGKTTTAINLASAFQQMGKSVLLVDLDPQANLTQSLGFRDELDHTLYELLRKQSVGDKADPDSVMLESSGLSLLPASLELANAELELVSIYGREKILKKILKPLVKSYDFILIDCPPSMGMLAVNALTASDYVLLPLQAEFLPLKGLQSFMQMFKRIRSQTNKKLAILGILLTKYDRRKRMTKNIAEHLETEFGDYLLNSKIRPNIALANAQERGVDIFTYDRSSHGAFDYLSLAEECLQRLNKAS